MRLAQGFPRWASRFLPLLLAVLCSGPLSSALFLYMRCFFFFYHYFFFYRFLLRLFKNAVLLLDVCDINVHLNIINDFVCILVHHSRMCSVGLLGFSHYSSISLFDTEPDGRDCF